VQFVVAGPDINLCYLSMAVMLQHVYRAEVPSYASHEGIMFVEPGEYACLYALIMIDLLNGNFTQRNFLLLQVRLPQL
jgi:hypothetical protein